MCGIAGIARHPDDQHFELPALQRASEALLHRGPDDEGYLIVSDGDTVQLAGSHTQAEWIKANKSLMAAECRKPLSLGLLHRRLSIIDTGISGHQPMSDAGGRYWITYNGEIYNYKLLREELQSLGYIFKTKSDTEVLLYAYAEWGEQCEAHLNGMWAFVIYDSHKQLLFASRDRTGVKPFYYIHQYRMLAFASEQSVFHRAGWLPFEVNRKAVFDFLYHDLLEHETEGLFKGVMELAPCHHFIYELHTDQLKISAYETPEINNSTAPIDVQKLQNYLNDIRYTVTAAIRSHLQSDVPVGTCLSGGLDSSILVSVIHGLQDQTALHTGTTQHAFHASFDDAEINETAFAEAVVKDKHITLHTVRPKLNELQSDLEKVVRAHGLPLRSFSSYAQYRVMQCANEKGIKVVLDGQGADELFGGYYPYIAHYLNDAQSVGGTTMVKKLRNDFFSDASSLRTFNRYQFKAWLKAGSLKHVLDAFHPAHRLLHKELFRYDTIQHTSKTLTLGLNKRLQLDYYGTYLKELLYREDRNAMAHHIESRVPFADDTALSQLLFSIPGIYKMNQGITKYLLREAFKDIIPAKVYTRRDKLGFASPNNPWMTSLEKTWTDYITPELGEYYNLKAYQRFISKLSTQHNKAENYKTLKWFMFSVWLAVIKSK